MTLKAFVEVVLHRYDHMYACKYSFEVHLSDPLKAVGYGDLEVG